MKHESRHEIAIGPCYVVEGFDFDKEEYNGCIFPIEGVEHAYDMADKYRRDKGYSNSHVLMFLPAGKEIDVCIYKKMSLDEYLKKVGEWWDNGSTLGD